MLSALGRAAEYQAAEQAEHRLLFRHVVEGIRQTDGVKLGENVVRGPQLFGLGVPDGTQPRLAGDPGKPGRHLTQSPTRRGPKLLLTSYLLAFTLTEIIQNKAFTPRNHKDVIANRPAGAHPASVRAHGSVLR